MSGSGRVCAGATYTRRRTLTVDAVLAVVQERAGGHGKHFFRVFRLKFVNKALVSKRPGQL